MKISYLLSVVAALALPGAAYAHEFWIEPEKYQVSPQDNVIADLRNGQLFVGTAQAFYPARNTRLDRSLGDETSAIEGRLGDRPAIRIPPLGDDGLLILLHEAAASSLTYKEWEKFVAFVEHKDFTTAVETHEDRGWAKEDFEEVYTRHSKALIAVGSGEGSDRAFGLATEFVALENPYAPDFDGTLDVELLYGDAPRADAQIEVYAKDAAGEVELTVTRTDAQGRASIPVEPGLSYLLDAVVLRPVEGATTVADGPIWETLWAALTFAVPAR
ncbi:DUF4198 domain-containing protein [Sulfitobacter sp. HNIBRBA3233]|uniref:DUF4198 domain-containing protein n=1 Tax=Sulfitobacter marinivivus TaxID=3158558 RepID=UPI0032DFACCF